MTDAIWRQLEEAGAELAEGGLAGILVFVAVPGGALRQRVADPERTGNDAGEVGDMALRDRHGDAARLARDRIGAIPVDVLVLGYDALP